MKLTVLARHMLFGHMQITNKQVEDFANILKCVCVCGHLIWMGTLSACMCVTSTLGFIWHETRIRLYMIDSHIKWSLSLFFFFLEVGSHYVVLEDLKFTRPGWPPLPLPSYLHLFRKYWGLKHVPPYMAQEFSHDSFSYHRLGRRTN